MNTKPNLTYYDYTPQLHNTMRLILVITLLTFSTRYFLLCILRTILLHTIVYITTSSIK